MNASMVLISELLTVTAHPILLVLLIVGATFVLEDVATVSIALLASQMVIDTSIALPALVVGTVLGDLAVYGVARRASHVPVVARFLASSSLRPVIGWIDQHALGMVLVARFTPGLRLPVFAGAGSLGVPFSAFATVIVLSTLVWTPGLYWAANTLGAAELDQLGSYGWLLPLILIIGMAGAPRIVSAVMNRREAVLVGA